MYFYEKDVATHYPLQGVLWTQFLLYKLTSTTIIVL